MSPRPNRRGSIEACANRENTPSNLRLRALTGAAPLKPVIELGFRHHGEGLRALTGAAPLKQRYPLNPPLPLRGLRALTGAAPLKRKLLPC